MAVPSYDGPAAAASVIMSPTVRGNPILFVEGICEVSLITHHFPEYEAQIVPCGGHEGVKEAIKAVEKWEAENMTLLTVLGFIDRDYGSRQRIRRITTSNHRDVEVDMYKSKAGERLLKEKASRNKCADARGTLDEAIDELRTIGLVRKLNSENGNRWNINDINLEKCIDKDGRIDTQKFFLLLQQKNCIEKGDINVLQSMLRNDDSIMTEAVIRGHDLSIMIGKWLRKRIGNRTKQETSWRAIEEDLRLATERTELLRYHWARRIREHLTSQIRPTQNKHRG
jgi:hypothetical protein